MVVVVGRGLELSRHARLAPRPFPSVCLVVCLLLPPCSLLFSSPLYYNTALPVSCRGGAPLTSQPSAKRRWSRAQPRPESSAARSQGGLCQRVRVHKNPRRSGGRGFPLVFSSVNGARVQRRRGSRMEGGWWVDDGKRPRARWGWGLDGCVSIWMLWPLGSGLGVNWLIDGGGQKVESARLCYTAIAAGQLGWEW